MYFAKVYVFFLLCTPLLKSGLIRRCTGTAAGNLKITLRYCMTATITDKKMASRHKSGAQKRKEKRKREEDHRGERDYIKKFFIRERSDVTVAGIDSGESRDDGK